MRGPVGSLALPDNPDEFEAFDAGSGVTAYVHRALLAAAPDGTIAFHFGMRGRCTVVVDSSNAS